MEETSTNGLLMIIDDLKADIIETRDPEEKAKLVAAYEKLYKVWLEENKHYDEIESETRKNEEEVAQRKEDKMLKYIEIGLTVAGTVLIPIISMIAYDLNFQRGLRFEKDGNICSLFVRNHASKLKTK